MTASKSNIGGAVVLGIIGTGVGVFVVDYYFSAPGHSWADQIIAKLKGDGGSDIDEHKKRADQLHADSQHLSQPSQAQLPPVSHRPTQGPTPLRPNAHAHTQQYVAPPPYTAPQAASARAPAPSSAVVREAQSRLDSLGLTDVPGVNHLPLSVDGILGHDTQAFLGAMQMQWGLPVTGYPDPQTMTSLRSATTSSTRVAPTSQSAPPLSSNGIPSSWGAIAPSLPPTVAMVKEVAQRLNALLHPATPLALDGTVTDGLSHAITQFQQQAHLPVTGFPDQQTLELLRAQTLSTLGLPPPQRSSPATRGGFFTGASPSSGWMAETKSLGPMAQGVIQKALDIETDGTVLQSLGLTLRAAGFHQAAAVVLTSSSQPRGGHVPQTTMTGMMMVDPYGMTSFEPDYSGYGWW